MAIKIIEITPEMHKKIEKLKLEEKYDEIYAQFGRDVYFAVIPKSYKKKDLAKLKAEGKYEDIFYKYGEIEYNKLLRKAMYNEIKENKGTVRAITWKIGTATIRKIQSLALSAVMLFPGLHGLLSISATNLIEENSQTYQDEIKAYNTKIDNYAEKVQLINLTDIQIFMKVMDDMWNGIKGYGDPEHDIIGFLELDLATEEGYGVCRNMASDVAKKLNAINPNYNARTINVYISENGDYQIADIERKVIETNDTVMDDREENNTVNIISNILGNHMVTLVDISEENLTLVLDPTNPGIGIFKSGKIIMLNSDKTNSKDFFARPLVEPWFKGEKEYGNLARNYIESFKKAKLTFQEIEQKYGLEAQNEALMQVRELSTVQESKTKETKTFDEKYKVDIFKKDNSRESNINSSKNKSKSIKNISIDDEDIER